MASVRRLSLVLLITSCAVVAVTTVTQLVLPEPAGADVDEAAKKEWTSGYVARNIVEGESITVCGSDYPRALGEAAGAWNTGLQDKGYVADSFLVFKVSSTCPSGTDTKKIHYVKVSADVEGGPNFKCSKYKTGASAGMYPTGCFTNSPRKGSPDFTFVRAPTIYMNKDKRDPLHEDASDPMYSETKFNQNRRTLAHELGHVLGLSHPHAAGTCTNALMSCPPKYPLKDSDYLQYATLYKPNVVVQIGTREFAEEVSGRLGVVRFNFDASKVKVEHKIEIRLWDAGSARWGDIIWSSDHSRGLIQNEEVPKQPTGQKKYGIFSTTSAYLNKDDPDLTKRQVSRQVQDPTNPGKMKTEWLGFVQEVKVGTSTPPPVTRYTLTVDTPTGSGTIKPGLGTHTYDEDHKQTVTATPKSGHRVRSWSGACAGTPITSPATNAQTCTVKMDGNKTVGVTFEEVPTVRRMCTLTVIPNTGGSDNDDTGGTVGGGGTVPCSASTRRTATGSEKAGYDFSHWSGDCSGSGACQVTMDRDRNVTAHFVVEPPPPQCTLTVIPNTGGSDGDDTGGTVGGGGTVPCSASTRRTATASEKAGYDFSHWSGDCSGSGACRVTMDRDRSVKAHFVVEPPPQCPVVAVGSTGGTASGSDTVDCGESVTIKATANSGYCFNYWQQLLPPGEFARQTSSSCATSSSISVKTSSGNVIYQAVFRAKRSYTLSAAAVPRSAGSVTGAGSYTEGTPVTLTARAVAPYYLKAWIGCDSSSGTTCKVTMNRNRTVTASFDNLCESIPDLCARAESE